MQRWSMFRYIVGVVLCPLGVQIRKSVLEEWFLCSFVVVNRYYIR